MSFHSTHRKDGDDFEEQILAKAVKAGLRTYFFDVRTTCGGDYFLTITESEKLLPTEPCHSTDVRYFYTRKVLGS